MTKGVIVLGCAIAAVSVQAKAWNEGAPKINGPKVYGATPNRNFMYAFPTTGDRVGLWYEVSEGALPQGVALDAVTGVLTGKVAAAGSHTFKVRATNRCGADEKAFALIIGKDALALTPPMGWTSWSACTTDIDQDLIRATAQALVDRGLAACGYAYVNIDSCWQGRRNAKDNAALQPNELFPDMGALVRDIHALGLKAGIYTTPMVHAWGTRRQRLLLGSTDYPLDPEFPHPHFGGCGKKSFEKDDALQFARWGFDWLKYDWSHTEVYHSRTMRTALDATDRDIVLQVCTGCQVTNAAEYAKCVQLARGSGDTWDEWYHIRARVMRRIDAWLPSIRPGFWCDLDMLALGSMRIRRNEDRVRAVRPGEKVPQEMVNKLTPDEIVSHFAWWAIVPSPIFLSCDIFNLDDFTYRIVTNEDLLEINQDYPAQPATYEDFDGTARRLWTRKLSDGRTVLGFFNLHDKAEWNVTRDLGGTFAVRDCLAGKDLGALSELKLSLRTHECRVFLLK